MEYIFRLFINGSYLVLLLSILVNQYYSYSRFIRVVINLIKRKINLLLIFLSILILFLISNKLIVYLLSLLVVIIFLIKNKIIKFTLTRRNSILLISSLIVLVFIPIVSIFSSLLVLSLFYLLTLPIELAIRNYYFSKARDKLNKVNPLVIGITGSYGKTTFKNLLCSSLKGSYVVSYPKGNINTPNGISSYINNNLKDNTEILIVELGIDSINGMRKFSKLLKLDIAVITSIGENHLSNFKSLENTFRSKYQIVELLKEEGKVYFSKDSIYLDRLIENKRQIGFSKDNILVKGMNEKGIFFELDNYELSLPLYGEYIFSYIDGIKKISEFLGVNKTCFLEGLRNILPINRRLEVKKYKQGYFINDSYNINLNGVKESLKVLHSFKGEGVVVIGGIIEQGKYFTKHNKDLRDLLKNENVIFIGSKHHPLVEFHSFKKLFIVSSLKQAYTLIDTSSFTNILLLAKSEDIYLK